MTLIQRLTRVHSWKLGFRALSFSSMAVKKRSQGIHGKWSPLNASVALHEPRRRYANEPEKSNPSPTPAGDSRTDEGAQRPAVALSRGEKLKLLVTQYGSVVMTFHITMSLASLGLMYVAVRAGLPVAAMAKYFGAELSGTASTASTFAVAYVAHKLWAPGRIAITGVTVPVLVPWLRRQGYLKTPPAPPSQEPTQESRADEMAEEQRSSKEKVQ